MPEIAEYRITVGNNTNVTATTKNLTAEQQKALQELQKMVPGDISISADGVVSITSQKGLALFNSFCQQNNISDTHGALMQIDVPEGTTLPLEGLKNASAFCTSFGRGETDPSKMSLTELMTFMLMMTYASEEEHRRVLSEVKATQLQIAMEVAINTWESSREAAEKTCNAETLQAWGTVASGVANAFIAIGSAVYTPKASASKREQLASNKYDLAKNQSLQDQQKLQTELEMADSQQVTIEAKQAEINTEIQQSEKELTAHQQKKQNEVKVKNEEIAEKNEAITEKNEAITEKDQEITAKNQEIAAAPEAAKTELKAAKTELERAKTELERDKTELERDKTKLEAAKTELEREEANLKANYEKSQVKKAKLDELDKIRKDLDNGNLVMSNRLSEGEVKKLEAENQKLEAELKDIETKGNAISSLAQSASSVIKGLTDLPAAGLKREAAFLEAETRLLDSFRGAMQSQTQGIDASINTANQNMQKIASTLKQVLDETYGVMSSIARNI